MNRNDELRKILDHEGGVSRRAMLAYGAALGSIPLLGKASWADSRPSFASDPFALGVASGEPTSDGFVLWTRLAPAPLEPYGGMPAHAVEVTWELADDEAMTRVVRRGKTLATPQLGHAVHIELAGLDPDRWYWYRFHSGDATSPVGRTRTFPAADASPEKLTFAFASCQHYEAGLYTAYEGMARDELDLVIHLGDYIYEKGPSKKKTVRKHVGGEIQSLGDYRVRHSLYRSDPLLQGTHARCPWMVTWDDHEVDNNYADDVSEQSRVDPVDFLVRRANAYQAYYEMMPLRARSLPSGPNMRLYRKASFGDLAELLVLDTRQHRSDQPNGDIASPLNDAALRRSGTMLGKRQKHWLKRSLLGSRATWNVLAQQVMMGLVSRWAGDDGEPRYSMDQWPGYAAERKELMRFLADRRVPNPVVLTGDIHCNWANELRVDDRNHTAPVVAAEFVGTSISSGGNGLAKPTDHDSVVASNPCVRFYNRERGYVRCTLTPDAWVSDYMAVDNVLTPGGKVFKRASFALDAGNASLQQG
ncbi:Alkaline phosphatase D precursor [Pseudobythopirellula maris]|uniref:Alkaline phosphatase D n=1 Tax=Pseudobythopirellula maris TaxID=2527991 RepID=A0A5C5ZI19_9BACT|nr:alkaline phosphatase D family protein [Pseudobythopirellula maris]TWT86193.1 Alkaline phosphatase D precursor [Pseudobythopirellula maris]